MTANPPPSFDRPRPDRRLRGNPLRTTWEYFLTENGDLSAGIWSCEPSAWNIAFGPGRDEFFCLIEGRLRITDSDRQTSEFGPGDACIIPTGFTGTFEVLQAVRKHYVLIERPA